MPKAAKPAPDMQFEQAARDAGRFCVAGVDEVGRGPIAGPVTAAAVILDPDRVPPGLNDSKALTAKRREALYDQIMQVAEVAIISLPPAEVDRLNIRGATHEAMRQALAALPTRPDHALIDGHEVPQNLICPADCLIKGDGRSCSIAAASIVAKVTRDRLMVGLAQHYPGYGWEQNAGYPTKSHISALIALGVTPHHRRSFKPVHNILLQGNYLTP